MSSSNAQNFTAIISSDPQYPWVNIKPKPPIVDTNDGCASAWDFPEDDQKKKEERSYLTIKTQYEDFNKLFEGKLLPFPILMTIVNGDLTQYGHPKELTVYKELNMKLGMELWMGLGNHDYENNVDDTMLNLGAHGMVDYMFDHERDHKNTIIASDVIVTWNPGVKMVQGSLAYSFDSCGIHWIQLQNRPCYRNLWGNYPSGSTRWTCIEDSWDWFEYDLKLARNAGKIIIVNMHDFGDTGPDKHDKPKWSEEDEAKFKALCITYEVTAVFCGHKHEYCRDVSYSYKWDLPTFRSGAASYCDYLLVEVDFKKMEMEVKRRQSKNNDGIEKNYVYETQATLRTGIKLKNSVPTVPYKLSTPVGYIVVQNNGLFFCSFQINYKNPDGKAAPMIDSGQLRAPDFKVYRFLSGCSSIVIEVWYQGASGYWYSAGKVDASIQHHYRFNGDVVTHHIEQCDVTTIFNDRTFSTKGNDPYNELPFIDIPIRDRFLDDSNSNSNSKISIKVLEGKNLAAKDLNGLSDPYIKIKSPIKIKSNHVCNTLDPKWDYQFQVEGSTKQVVIEVWDHDTFSLDDFMGMAVLDISKLTGSHVWIDLQQKESKKKKRETITGSIHLCVTRC